MKFLDSLYRTRKTLKEVCEEYGIEYDPNMNTYPLAQCASCSIWHNYDKMPVDLDGNKICYTCLDTYGP